MAEKNRFRIYIDDKINLRGMKALQARLGKVKTAALDIGRHFKRMAGVVAGAFAAVGIGSVKAASDMESLRAQLEAVLGSAAEAEKAFKESFDFSVATPFSPEDIVKTRIALESVGVTGADAVEKVATAAAAMGRNIIDVASAVRSMETEPLRNLGIMLKKNGDEFIFNYKDKMKQARSVTATGFAEAQQTLLDIMGGRFEGGLEKMSQTFSGLWSTMVGNLKAALSDFGTEYLPSVKAGVTSVINALNELRGSGKLKEWGQAVNEALTTAAENISGILTYIKTEGADGVGQVMANIGLFLKGAAKSAMEAGLKILAVAVPAIGRALGEAAKEALWSDSLGSQAEAAAVAQAKQEFGTEDRIVTSPYGGSNTIKDGAVKGAGTPAYEKRLKELEREHLKRLLKERGQELAGNFGTGAGALDMEQAAGRLKGLANLGTATADADNADKAQKKAEQQARTLKASQSMEEANAIVARQRKEHQAAINATQVYGMPSDQSMANLENERNQSGQVSGKLQEIARGLMSVRQADQQVAEALIAEIRADQQGKVDILREIENLRAEIRTNRS